MSVKENQERAATRVARNIVSDIQERSLRPGAKLEPEHVMVEQQGVARGTVREALRYLEFQGALRIKAGPGGGPIVPRSAVASCGTTTYGSEGSHVQTIMMRRAQHCRDARALGV